MFPGRIPNKILDIKLGVRPQKFPSPDFQIVQDVLEQMEMIFQDVRKIAMPAYIKYKAYYDKKSQCLKIQTTRLRLHPTTKSRSPRKQSPRTDFRWIGPYIIGQVLPNKNNLVRKIGTNRTQTLHRRRLRQSTSRQPKPDIPITPREWQPDPQLTIKHDDLYARA